MKSLVLEKEIYLSHKDREIEKELEFEKVALHVTSKKSELRYIYPLSRRIDLSIRSSLRRRIIEFSPMKFLDVGGLDYLRDVFAGKTDILSVESEIVHFDRKIFKETHYPRFMGYNFQNREEKPEGERPVSSSESLLASFADKARKRILQTGNLGLENDARSVGYQSLREYLQGRDYSSLRRSLLPHREFLGNLADRAKNRIMRI